jgi:hypothetical protein
MRKLLLFTLPLLLAFRPGGEPEFFTWKAPTQRVDGTSINAVTEISAYTLKCDREGVPAYEQVIGAYGDTRWNVPPSTFGIGTWVCYLYATDMEARRSDPSAGVEFLVSVYQFTVAPNPPTDLSVG